MSKTERKRQQIAENLADVILASGLAGASLRPLASAVGTSDRMLLYYFKGKDEIISAALTVIAGRLAAALEAFAAPPDLTEEALAEMLLRNLQAPALWPYMAIWLEIVALASRGDAFYRSVGNAIASGFLAWIAERLSGPPPARARAALRVLRLVEGSLVLHSIGVGDG